MLKFAATALLSTALVAVPLSTANAGSTISNDINKCRSGSGSAILVTVDGVKSSTGKMRVQSYRGTASEWLKSGKWLTRIEAPAQKGSMTFCVPVDSSGAYGIAVRHDKNGNGKTDLSSDGGGMSNNPSINIFNLGKPSYKKTRFTVGNAVKSIRIQMKYL